MSRLNPAVAIVDDHPVVLAGVRSWFDGAGIAVTAAGGDPRIAWSPDGLRADVVVLDLQLADRPTVSWDALADLVAAGRRVIVYTMREDRETALRCLDAGCATFLTKAEGEEHLVAAVRAAAQDLPYVPPALAGAMSADDTSDRPRLTDREQEVLLAWFQCESKQLVAARCNLSPRTVEGYIDRVRVRYARAGRPAPTKAALVARALQDGLIQLDDL
ncbi:response regulator transcription factor [Actinoplanes sp. NPDC089786]|uniref:response regulator transcription factor n=1 Tax=Actinoplanes sp. NPDC089786 TaxID=3155185 RepID=UPI00343D90E8